MILADTNVLSELMRPRPEQQVVSLYRAAVRRFGLPLPGIPDLCIYINIYIYIDILLLSFPSLPPPIMSRTPIHADAIS